jgi:Gpi18-like mannosyltransferase
MIENQPTSLADRLAPYENRLILGIGVILAVWLRLALSPMQTLDFVDFTGPWLAFIRANGSFRALQADFTNYTPAYLYLLVIAEALVSWLPDVLIIKLPALIFDIVAAALVYRLVALRHPAGSAPLFAFLAVLFAPTVFLNSSFWGQADVIYTAGVLAALYFLFVGQERAGLIAFGLAFAFKLQAIFFAPVLLLLWLCGRISWRSFLWIPTVYLLSILPAWLAGRPLLDLLLIYTRQADFYRALTMNAANIYQWLPDTLYDLLLPAGLLWSVAAVLLVVAAVYKSRQPLTNGILLQLATFFAVLLPYLLPKMHDRYFFLADVLAIVYAFYFPRYVFLPVLVGLTSLLSYWPFLFGREIISLSILAFVPLITLLILGRHLAHTLFGGTPFGRPLRLPVLAHRLPSSEVFATFTFTQLRRYRLDMIIMAGLALATALLVYQLQQQINPVAYDPVTADAWFDSDLHRVYANLTNRLSDHYRTTAHPLFSLIAYPPVALLIHLFGLQPVIAVRLFIAAAAAVWLALLYLLLRLVTGRSLDAALFSLVATVSAAAFFWLTVPETYVFGSISVMSALLFTLLAPALAASRLPLRWWATLVSALTLTITLTNWMAGLIVTVLHFSWKRVIQISLNALVIVVLLWVVQKAFFPSAGFFLGGVSEESRFFLPERSGGPLAVIRSFFLHTIAMPESVQLPRHQAVPPYPTLMLTQSAPAGSGGIWGALAIPLWVGMLGFGLKGWAETKKHRTLRLALLFILLGQLLLHLLYGDETFIYSLHILPLLVLLASLGSLTAERPLVLVMAALLVVTAALNNYRQFRQAAAFFDQPTATVVQTPLPPLLIEEEQPFARERVLNEISQRPDDPWPRGIGHVILAIPGSPEISKGYYEPGGSFSPAVGSFGLSLWVLDDQGQLLATSDDLLMTTIEQHFVWPAGSPWPAIQTITPYYEASWLPLQPGQWQLDLHPSPDLTEKIALVVRSVGPAGGPITHLSWDGRLHINERWQITPSGTPAVQMGREGENGWLSPMPSADTWQGDDGWGYARLTFDGQQPIQFTVTQTEAPSEAPSEAPFPAGPAVPRLSTALQLDLPEPHFAASLDAQLAHLLMSFVGNETRPGDPVNYPLTWQRDAAYIVVALARSGQVEQARQLTTHLAENDFFGGFGAEADAPGLALWAIHEVALYLDDPQFEQQMWPHITRKVALIEQMLAAERPLYYPFTGPVIPQLLNNPEANRVADPARDGLIIGRMDHHRPLLYVNAITYRGLLDAAALAERLGHTAEAAQWQTTAANLQQAWKAAFQTAEAGNERTYISALWPSWVALPESEGVVAGLEERWQSRRTADGRFRDRPLWTYFEVAEAHQWLYLNRLDRLWPTLNWFWDNQTTAGLYSWWEGSGEENSFNQWPRVRGWVDPPYVSPHYWTTAEMLLLQLDMLVHTTSSGAVVIGAGVPPDWLDSPLHAGPIPTPTGSVEWHWDGETLAVHLTGPPVEIQPGPSFADVPLVVQNE